MTKNPNNIISSAISTSVLMLCFYFFVTYFFTDLMYEDITDKYFLPFCFTISIATPLFLKSGSALLFFKSVHYAADITARYFLCYILFLYSIKKIVGNMFSLSLSALDAPLGATSGFTLAWRFFGFNWKFDLLIALSQIAIGLLLLYKKTVYAGALLSFLMFSFILSINVFIGIHIIVPVIAFVLLSLYILSPVIKSLYAVLVVNKATLPVLQPSLLVSSKTKRIVSMAGFLFITVTAAVSFYNENVLRRSYLNKSVLFGGWKQLPESLLMNKNDSVTAIDKIYFEEADGCVVKDIESKSSYATLNLDTMRHVLMIAGDDKKELIKGAYKIKGDTLIITSKNHLWKFEKFTILDKGNYGDVYSLLQK